MRLGRDEVLEGALALLEKEGLDGLTMRRLAASLGVRAGAIYWHFADKQALVDAMIETMLAGLLEPAPTGTWDEQIAELTRRMAAAMLRVRDGARLATLALRPGPNSLDLSEAMMQIIRKSGRSRRATLWASAVIGYYVLGYVTDLQATEAAKARGLMSVVRGLRKSLARADYPLLHSISDTALAQMLEGRDAQARFEFGLQVILRGLAGADEAKRPPQKKRRAPRRRG
jgi:TetR/AcrR family transcriptional regulator, tetracycline repressor protein